MDKTDLMDAGGIGGSSNQSDPSNVGEGQLDSASSYAGVVAVAWKEQRTATQVTGLNNVVQVSCGGCHTCYLLADGTLMAAGQEVLAPQPDVDL